MQAIEFFFDYGSPYSFLANGVIGGLAEEHAASITYRPMLLGGVFKATGNQSPMMETVEAKRNYGGAVLRRTADQHGLAIAMNPHFPINTIGVMRLAVAAQREGVFDAYHGAMYPSFWQRGLNLGDKAVQADVVKSAGLDAQQLLARAGDDDVKAELRANTEEAVERGAFGAPTFFVDGEMFFGVDHLPHLVRKLGS
ncbi:MAG: 2-hydroxychromene-2-carboxylate isomerase [Myxococcota bacterium]|jgi:2-hydroxychromene-2-carboxylate isomerase